jgi:hypothetical protein
VHDNIYALQPHIPSSAAACLPESHNPRVLLGLGNSCSPECLGDCVGLWLVRRHVPDGQITLNPSLLREKNPSSVSTVVLGGGEEHAVECEGTAVLAGGPAGPVHLAHVLCVPTLSLHLCSGSQVTGRGAVVTQRGDAVIIEDTTGRRLLPGVKKGGMYQLDCDRLPTAGGTPQAFANATTTTELWHGHLGHVPVQEVSKLAKGDEHGSCERDSERVSATSALRQANTCFVSQKL